MARLVKLIMIFAWAISLSLPLGVYGQTSTMVALNELAPLLEKAGLIISNLAEGIEKANASGLRIYDTYKARAARERLRGLRMDILGLPQGQMAGVLDPLDDYLAAPSDDNWAAVRMNLDKVLDKVVNIEQRLKEEHSDFVLDPSFPDLMETIQAREGILVRLKNIDAPRTDAELRSLKAVRDRYAQLIEQLRRLRKSLDNYLRRQP